MKVVTTESLNREQDHIGMVRGVSYKKDDEPERDFTQGVKEFLRVESPSYDEILDRARESAVEEMKEKASDMGADAVVAVRFDSNQIKSGVEVTAYGTAVELQ